MCRVTPSSIKIDGTHLNVWTKGGTGNISRDTVGLKKKNENNVSPPTI